MNQILLNIFMKQCRRRAQVSYAGNGPDDDDDAADAPPAAKRRAPAPPSPARPPRMGGLLRAAGLPAFSFFRASFALSSA